MSAASVVGLMIWSAVVGLCFALDAIDERLAEIRDILKERK